MIYTELGEYNMDMSRDMRKYARQTEIRTIIAFLIILFVVGDGLLWFFYGKQTALLGALCMLAGLVPLGLVFMIFGFLDWVLKRRGDQ